MTAKTHYAIYALLGVIILLLLYFVISERSARNTDISSLQGQLTEAASISDAEAIEMTQNFVLSTCYAFGASRITELRNFRSHRDRRLGEDAKWYVAERNDQSIIVVSSHRVRRLGIYDEVKTYKINIKTKQISKLFYRSIDTSDELTDSEAYELVMERKYPFNNC